MVRRPAASKARLCVFAAEPERWIVRCFQRSVESRPLVESLVARVAAELVAPDTLWGPQLQEKEESDEEARDGDGKRNRCHTTGHGRRAVHGSRSRP